MVERIRRITRAQTVSIASLAPKERALIWRATEGNHGRQGNAVDLSSLIDEQALAQLTNSEQMLVLDSAATQRDSSPRDLLFPKPEQNKVFLVLPLRARAEFIGVLAIGFNSAAPQIDHDYQNLLESLAELAALTLDNSLLFETVSAAKRVWEQTFDAIPDGIIVHDHELLIARCNLRAAEMLGLPSPAAAIGLSRSETFAKLFGERAAAYHVKPSAGGASSFEMQSESGRRYLISVAPFATIDSQHEWSVLTWSDVTELSEMQDQLARARRLAMVGQLAAGVAHEINNPLAAITTCAETMLLDISESAAAAEVAADRDWVFYLEEVVRQALRGKAITRGLLDLARPRRAEQRPCNLPKLLAHCVKLFRTLAPVGIHIDSTIDPEIEIILTDEAMLRQILDNLLRNALDALNGVGSIILKAGIEEGRLLIEVTDTGPGIPSDLLTRVFEPFYTTKEVGKGSGLGLSISAMLAENLGGALTAHSKEGIGSQFLLWLPYRPVDTSEELKED